MEIAVRFGLSSTGKKGSLRELFSIPNLWLISFQV
jgi:hypothetical protein